MPRVLLIAWERFSEIKHAFINKQYQTEEIQELMCKLLEDVQNIKKKLSELTNSSSWDRPMIVDDKEHSIQFRLYLENSSKAIAPDLPTEEPEYSLKFNADIADMIIESLSPFPIPVEDSDSQREEISLCLDTDDLMPLGSENDDYDSEGDIHILEELLSNDTN
nr:hypothetical protein [Tanacetum cinerariifolium]